MEVRIDAVTLLGPHELPMAEFDSGDPLSVQIFYSAEQPVEQPILGLSITREDGFVCYDTSTEMIQGKNELWQGNGQAHFNIEHLDLIGGRYYVDVGVYRSDWSYAYDYHWHVYPLTIRPTRGEKGVIRPAGKWELL
jgi:lipopolysaccharide transport system ATP-binding protein